MSHSPQYWHSGKQFPCPHANLFMATLTKITGHFIFFLNVSCFCRKYLTLQHRNPNKPLYQPTNPTCATLRATPSTDKWHLKTGKTTTTHKTRFGRQDLLYFDFAREQMLLVVSGNNSGLSWDKTNTLCFMKKGDNKKQQKKISFTTWYRFELNCRK